MMEMLVLFGQLVLILICFAIASRIILAVVLFIVSLFDKRWTIHITTSDNYCIVGYFKGNRGLYNKFPNHTFTQHLDSWAFNKSHIEVQALLKYNNWFYPDWVEFRKSELIKLPA